MIGVFVLGRVPYSVIVTLLWHWASRTGFAIVTVNNSPPVLSLPFHDCAYKTLCTIYLPTSTNNYFLCCNNINFANLDLPDLTVGNPSA